MKKRKVAVFGVKTVPHTGGIETVIEHTLPYIDNYKFIVYVRKKYYNNEKLSNVSLKVMTHFDGKYVESISHTLFSLFHAIFFEKADIFFFHAVVLGVFTPFPKIFGKKVILQTHGLDWKREKWGYLSKSFIKFSTFLAAFVPDKVICVGNADRDFFFNKYHKNFSVVPNGVTYPNFKEDHKFLEKYNLRPKNYFLFMARLVPEKGAHILVEAFKNLKTFYKFDDHIKLVIAGDTNYHDEYYNSLKANESDEIVFTGFINNDEKYTILNNASCFVQPSTIEGMSTGLLEAMLFGVFPIVSNIKENIDVVNNFGLSFQANSSKDLESTLHKFLLEKEKFIKSKDKMITFTKENYSWSKTIISLVQILHTL